MIIPELAAPGERWDINLVGFGTISHYQRNRSNGLKKQNWFSINPAFNQYLFDPGWLERIENPAEWHIFGCGRWSFGIGFS